ncbi:MULTISPECIES: hypothetical protein [Dyella]|uniref:Uncharacterized protein n=2 Tax=Dyella TaxID=231454 RepID=A0A4R0YDS0_9GAMM|nr:MULTISPECIES: hypothetical protein [Dyella]TBR36053.1 hypothetical protein EYV96_15710 [Dyella terrae]TCI06103.1 hypothetical protein EZM97_34805 [Dyella soli]
MSFSGEPIRGQDGRLQSMRLLAFTALGGLVAIPAVGMMVPYVGVSMVTALAAGGMMRLPGSRKTFFFLCLGNLALGCALYFTPHDANGGLNGPGIFLILAVMFYHYRKLRSMGANEAQAATPVA